MLGSLRHTTTCITLALPELIKSARQELVDWVQEAISAILRERGVSLP